MSSLTNRLTFWWDRTFTEDSLADWALLIPVFAGSYVLIYFGHRALKNLVRKKSSHTPWMEFVANFLETSHWPFFTAFSIYVSLLVSPIPYEYKSSFNKTFGVAVILQVGLWLNSTLTYLFREVLTKEADAAKTTVLRAVSVAAKFILWVAIFLLALDNFGVNITTLVAGLGIGGIALALGVQKIVGDIFASMSIVMDKPFVIGDYIVVGDLRGTVEDIGIKTTRLRSLGGERLVFSNSDLLESRIQNFTQMYRRRVEINLGITYETSVDKIRLAKKLVEDSIKKVEGTTFESIHFKSFGDFALVLNVIYWVNEASADANIRASDAINMNILEAFNNAKIEFAYPTQRLITETLNRQV